MSRMNWERAAKRDQVVHSRPPGKSELTYWLTILRHPTRCAECGHGPYKTMAYRHADQHALCEVCWTRLGILPTPSKRYLAAQENPQRSKQAKRAGRRRRRRR